MIYTFGREFPQIRQHVWNISSLWLYQILFYDLCLTWSWSILLAAINDGSNVKVKFVVSINFLFFFNRGINHELTVALNQECMSYGKVCRWRSLIRNVITQAVTNGSHLLFVINHRQRLMHSFHLKGIHRLGASKGQIPKAALTFGDLSL